jgi:hypothetical protein
MSATRKVVQVIPSVIMLMLLAFAAISTGAHTQSASEMRSSARSPQRCPGADPFRTARASSQGFDQLFAASETTAGELCDDSGVDEASRTIRTEAATALLVHPAGSSSEAPDSASRAIGQPSIHASGKEAVAIAHAASAVLDILRSNNSCSAWFAKSDPSIVEIFVSLQFWIERDGPGHITKERGDHGDWIERGPYVARTSESTGRGTNIAINAHGAFFQNKAEVFKIGWQQGYELPTNTWHPLHAGPYEGATAKAQILTLLHEFAHIVGAIPSDGLTPTGLNRSRENTETILKYCKSAVNASSNHAIIELAQNLPE